MPTPRKSKRTGVVLNLALVKASADDVTRAAALTLGAHVRVDATPGLAATPDAYQSHGGKWVIWVGADPFKLVWSGTLAPGTDRKRKHESSCEIDGRNYIAIQLAKRRARTVFNYDILVGDTRKDPQLIVDP